MSGWTGAGIHQLARLNSANLAWHFGRQRALATGGVRGGELPQMHTSSHDCYLKVCTVTSQTGIDVL